MRLVAAQDFSFRPGIDVTDVRQTKGLEFDIVILVDVNEESYPDNDHARRMLHVAMTRGAHQLWVTYTGNPSRLLPDYLRRSPERSVRSSFTLIVGLAAAFSGGLGTGCASSSDGQTRRGQQRWGERPGGDRGRWRPGQRRWWWWWHGRVAQRRRFGRRGVPGSGRSGCGWRWRWRRGFPGGRCGRWRGNRRDRGGRRQGADLFAHHRLPARSIPTAVARLSAELKAGASRWRPAKIRWCSPGPGGLGGFAGVVLLDATGKPWAIPGPRPWPRWRPS